MRRATCFIDTRVTPPSTPPNTLGKYPPSLLGGQSQRSTVHSARLVVPPAPLGRAEGGRYHASPSSAVDAFVPAQSPFGASRFAGSVAFFGLLTSCREPPRSVMGRGTELCGRTWAIKVDGVAVEPRRGTKITLAIPYLIPLCPMICRLGRTTQVGQPRATRR